MNKIGRPAHFYGMLQVEDINWAFRVYLMLGDPAEVVDKNQLFDNLAGQVRALAAEYVSSEFSYIKTGFIIAHYGRRGVAHSLWHWADWDGTWECFSQAWYCYGRTVENMTPLDRAEPVFCLHELHVVMNECAAFRTIASSCKTHAEIIEQYRECSPIAIGCKLQ
jgi:hypothetical protein